MVSRTAVTHLAEAPAWQRDAAVRPVSCLAIPHGIIDGMMDIIFPNGNVFPAVLDIFPVRERCMRQHVIRNSRELGKVVRQRRKTLALTQAALAAVAGVGVRFVSELERGKQTAEFQRVLNVLHVLGMDLEVVARAEADP